ncbi:N-succinylarginine dihydrolase [Marinobacter sp. MDS2]|uniref:N-succinylarginine dihydrolase n=1 Tax=Marinobacter sp. MDS2 TaxID=3065961 RepID=UPI00273BC044|nr:N-succinylarginine dihydrolase [Marinobacter sp. MDS2]MDP4547322.1 N-succinylarginine dihydrolase [Marinobacter sp. MDS2]
MAKHAVEANFDGLVGPTHNYAGLSWGNVASKSNVNAESNPKQAALQGLAKMKALADRGYMQGVLPPHERPHLPTLRALGFEGSDTQILGAAAKQAPAILAAVSSASTMWTANAATVSPSADTADHRVHFTPANLSAKFHRSIEHAVTGRALKAIFRDEQYFAHHPALPSVGHFGDEGAANHTRLCGHYGEPGVELFVYGQEAFNQQAPAPVMYPARQTLEASQAVARLHGLADANRVFAQQNPAAIDAGVFHNDVIAVGNGNCLFYHELAFLNEERVLAEIRERLLGAELEAIKVTPQQVPLEDAVSSYLFNSQLLNSPDGMLLVVPGECREVASVSRYLDELVASDGPITSVEVMDVKQSMRNGGGPACLRLRVVLNDEERHAINQGVVLTDELYARLTTWVETHYRDRLVQQDLADPKLLNEVRQALDELTGILQLGSIYDFQR